MHFYGKYDTELFSVSLENKGLPRAFHSAVYFLYQAIFHPILGTHHLLVHELHYDYVCRCSGVRIGDKPKRCNR